MQILLVEVRIKPELRRQFLELITSNAEHTRQEPGCLRFDLLEDNADPSHFVYYEVYADEAAQAAHRETDHFKRYIEESRQYTESAVAHRLHNLSPGDDAF